MRNLYPSLVTIVLAMSAAALSSPSAVAQQATHDHARKQLSSKPDLKFLHGAPTDAADSWALSSGGRMYDNWWEALGRAKPKATHRAYPTTGKTPGPDSWRCKECHGWDYKGRDGRYAQGSHATGIKGIRGAQGRDPKEIAALLRSDPHGYTTTMIRDDELMRLSAFVSRGQIDVDKHIHAATGDAQSTDQSPDGVRERGRGIFQATCAACHGFDGRRLNFGPAAKPAFVGTEARDNPWEVLHKIVNGHPGSEMINLRVFGAEDAAAVLGYARTLPDK